MRFAVTKTADACTEFSESLLGEVIGLFQHYVRVQSQTRPLLLTPHYMSQNKCITVHSSVDKVVYPATRLILMSHFQCLAHVTFIVLSQLRSEPISFPQVSYFLFPYLAICHLLDV